MVAAGLYIWNPGEDGGSLAGQEEEVLEAVKICVDQGNDVNVPPNIGIESGCLYWMHTHDNTGVIHIEAPTAQAHHTFTLGDFFNVWDQPLSRTQVGTLKLAPDQQLAIYVDGTKQPDGTDPRTIGLHAHTLVVLEITPPAVDPPPGYTFGQGL